MLWLHIGMPKTGTTALQGFVRTNGGLLDTAGLRYMETGRRRHENSRLTISHNIIAFHINQTQQPTDAFREAMALEYEAHKDKTCLVSSEMLYSVDLDRLAQIFSDIPARQMRITFYCRRYSDFWEADYKQRAKNGRLPAGGTQYIRARLDEIAENPERLSYSAMLTRIRIAFPGVTVAPFLYDRSVMANGNIVDDFMSRIGVTLPKGSTANLPSNPSQSRAASEAFGILARSIGRQRTRQLRRRVVDDPVMIRRNDVLEPKERLWLDEYLAAQDTDFQQEFFPDRDQLFPPVQLSDADLQFRRDSSEEYEALRLASEIVFRMALEE